MHSAAVMTSYALLWCRSCAETIVLFFSTAMFGRTPLDSSMNILRANNVNTLPWPSRSPGLAPIEHGWDMLNGRIRENRHPFNSLQALANALIIEWNAIPPCKIQKIIKGMQKRCTANRAWTRYWHCGFLCEFIMCHVLPP